jgi:hypothetical protein
MATAMALLASCHQQPQNPQPANQSTTKEPSDMRTVIPLVRRLEPTDTGPIELEFDVPALPDDDTPPVFVGVRIAGPDPTATAEVEDRLVDADVSARLHLFRLGPSGPVAVTLLRSDMTPQSGPDPIALPPDGQAPGLMRFDADYITTQAAGLLEQGRDYRDLAFAFVPELPAGRYRLALDFTAHRQALTEANAEFLVAYTAKGK